MSMTPMTARQAYIDYLTTRRRGRLVSSSAPAAGDPATIWHSLRRAGVRAPIRGAGRLLEMAG
jgi:hypothetical protein